MKRHPPIREPHRGSLRSWQRRTRRALLVLVGSGIGGALLMNGSVSAPYRQIAFLALTVPLLLTVFIKIKSAATQTALKWVMACLVLSIGWSLFQAAPLPFGGLSHSVWDELAELGIHTSRYISVSPIETLSALPSLILPFVVFAAMLILCQQREEALFAWTMLMVIGLSLAALSVILELFLPEVYFFSSVPVGNGVFNGIFVNRNVTASFLGILAFATAARLMVADPAKAPPQRQGGSWIDMNWIGWRQLALSIAVFLVTVGLITTGSRAGVTFGMVLLTLSFATLFLTQLDRRESARAHELTVRQKTVLAISIGTCMVLLFGEQTLSRMSAVGEDTRWCVWAATWQAVLDQPITGSGFGTFADVFPRYRDQDCLGHRDIVLRTHNSYLEFVVGTGVIGVLVLVIGFTGLIRILAIGIARRQTLKAIPVFTLGALCFVALHSVFDFPIQIPGIALYFAALMGVGCAVSLIERVPGPVRTRLRTGARADR